MKSELLRREVNEEKEDKKNPRQKKKEKKEGRRKYGKGNTKKIKIK